jgi:copper chaperone CopZ
MKMITYQMEGLTCPSCVYQVEKIMSIQPGVQEVKVLFNAQKVKITYNEENGNPKEFESILEQLGYIIKSQKIA